MKLEELKKEAENSKTIDDMRVVYEKVCAFCKDRGIKEAMRFDDFVRESLSGVFYFEIEDAIKESIVSMIDRIKIN